MNYAVVLPCAGLGSRMGLGYNKLLYRFEDGQTVIEKTLQHFIDDERCQQIVMAISPDDEAMVKPLLIDPRMTYVYGGASRQESVYHGLQVVSQDIVLVHDGARPFLQRQQIDDLLESLKTHQAALLMVPCVDTIKVVKDGIVQSTPDRSTLYHAQTPQGFHTKLLKQANELAIEKGFIATDDASIVEFSGLCDVGVVLGEDTNIKITTPKDLKNK